MRNLFHHRGSMMERTVGSRSLRAINWKYELVIYLYKRMLSVSQLLNMLSCKLVTEQSSKWTLVAKSISWILEKKSFPAGIYLLKVNNRKTRTRCEICSKSTIKTAERCHWRRSGVFLLLTLNIFHTLF